MQGPPYLVVSPGRDEADTVRTTLESVLRQTWRPALWVIVDDGSRDETPRIITEYAAQHPFIRLVQRVDRGRRSVGPGVVDAFYKGLASVTERFEYLCKLDLDLELPPRYFEILLGRMLEQPRLGTCSGKPYFRDRRGRLVPEVCGDEMSVGMTKLYRRTCFDEIGGFVRAVMWDGIDCHRCRMCGWQARSWDEPDLRFIHLRPMGSSQGSLWQGRLRHGRGQHFMGTGLAYLTASAVLRMREPPYVTGALGILVGYLLAMWERQPRYEDAAFRSFLRAYQRSCLMRGKRRATDRIDAGLDGGPDRRDAPD